MDGLLEIFSNHTEMRFVYHGVAGVDACSRSSSDDAQQDNLALFHIGASFVAGVDFQQQLCTY